MASGRNRRIGMLLAVAVVLTASIGAVVAFTAPRIIGSAGAEDVWAGHGVPVKFANEPTPSPAAEGVVNGIGGLRLALEARVIGTAGLIRPVASTCDTPVVESEFACHVTYQGEVVTYRVTTKPSTGDTYTWQAAADSMVVTRAGIEAAMWRKYATRATAMSCDASLPDKQRVHPRTALAQRCYFKPTGNDQAFGAASDNAGRTVAVKITVFDGALGFDELLQ